MHPVSSGSCGGGCSGGGCGGGSAGAFTDHPISITIDGIKYYYLYDGLGSVTELIDVNQNVVNTYRYTPFGDALVRQETVYNPHQFTGRQYDAESGLYHYRARAYSPDVGRFMQQDPAGIVDGPNMYAYVGNNPVNRRDPSGMFWWPTQKIRSLPGELGTLQIADPVQPIAGPEHSEPGPDGEDCQERCRCKSRGGYYPCNPGEFLLGYNLNCYADCNFAGAFYVLFQIAYATWMKPHDYGIAHM